MLRAGLPVALDLLVQPHRLFDQVPKGPIENFQGKCITPCGVLQVAAPLFQFGELVSAQGARKVEYGRTGAARRATSWLREELLPHVQVGGYAGYGLLVPGRFRPEESPVAEHFQARLPGRGCRRSAYRSSCSRIRRRA